MSGGSNHRSHVVLMLNIQEASIDDDNDIRQQQQRNVFRVHTDSPNINTHQLTTTDYRLRFLSLAYQRFKPYRLVFTARRALIARGLQVVYLSVCQSCYIKVFALSERPSFEFSCIFVKSGSIYIKSLLSTICDAKFRQNYSSK